MKQIEHESLVRHRKKINLTCAVFLGIALETLSSAAGLSLGASASSRSGVLKVTFTFTTKLSYNGGIWPV